MTERYESRSRTLLRAYPRRYRTAREAELLATLLDAAEPGRNIPSLRDSWDVIRGGLLTRWHDHPPLLRWLAYRILDARLPYRWRWWVRDDVLGHAYVLRRLLNLLFMLMLMLTGIPNSLWITLTVGEPFRLSGLAPLAAALLLEVLSLRFHRRWVLKRHGLAPEGLLLPLGVPAPWQVTPVPTSRRQVWPMLAGPALALLLTAPLALLALLFPFDGHPADDAVHSGRGYGVVEYLGGIGPVLIRTCGGALALAAILTLLAAARPARRLHRRQLHPGSENIAMPWEASALVTLGSILVALLIVGATYLHEAAVILPLALIMAGVTLGPPLIVVSLIARSVERRTDAFVTFTDIVWATLSLPGTPPPAATRPMTVLNPHDPTHSRHGLS
jgi:hypothetical protein